MQPQLVPRAPAFSPAIFRGAQTARFESENGSDGDLGNSSTRSREFPYANECGNIQQRALRSPGGGNFPGRLCQRRSLQGSAWRGPASPAQGWQSALVIGAGEGGERTQVGEDEPQPGGLSQQEKPLPRGWGTALRPSGVTEVSVLPE